MADYPIEGIRGVLSSITDKGIDITKPLLTTFDGQLPNYDVRQHQEIRSRIIEAGYEIGEVETNDDGENSSVLFECNKLMILTLEAVCAEYKNVDETLSPFGGYCDGFVVTLPKSLS